MKENLEKMTITELTEEAKKRMIDYELDAGAVLDGLDVTSGLISDSECESKLANLLNVLVERMAELQSLFIADMNSLLYHIGGQAEAITHTGSGDFPVHRREQYKT